MNPFDRIRDYRAALLLQIKDTMVKPDDSLTYKEHYQVLLNLLKMLETDLQEADYEYVLNRVGSQAGDSAYYEYDGVTMRTIQLNDNLLLFQPLFSEDHEIGVPDMNSLIEALEALKDYGKITQECLVIPPGINVIKARLYDPEREDEAPTVDDEIPVYDVYDNNIDESIVISRNKMVDDSDCDDLPF